MQMGVYTKDLFEMDVFMGMGSSNGKTVLNIEEIILMEIVREMDNFSILKIQVFLKEYGKMEVFLDKDNIATIEEK